MERMIDLIDLGFFEKSITKIIGGVSSDLSDRLDRPDRLGSIIKEKIKITENPQKVSIKSIRASNRCVSRRRLIDTQVYQCLSQSIKIRKGLEQQGFEVSIRGKKIMLTSANFHPHDCKEVPV